MAVDPLAVSLKCSGILKIGKYRHYAIRTGFCVMDIITAMYMVYVATVSLGPSGGHNSEVEGAMYVTYFCDLVYCAFMYVWGIRFANRHQLESQDPSIRRWAVINLAVILIIDILIAYFLITGVTSTDMMRIYFCPSCLVVLEFFYAIIIKLQYYAVNLLVSGKLMLFAKDIDAITTNLSIDNVHDSVEDIRNFNAYLNNEFGTFLVLFHVHYFVRLFGEVSSLGMSIQCGEGYYKLLGNLGVLHIFLLIIYCSDRIEKRIQRFRRKIFYIMVANRSDYLDLFLSQKFGLEADAGFSSALSWKTCLSFISFSWSFAFVAWQFAEAAKPATCD